MNDWRIDNLRMQLTCSKNSCPCSKSGPQVNLHCPSHNDENPSLGVTESPGGKVLIHCFAGCQYKDIASMLDRKVGDNSFKSPTSQAKRGLILPETTATLQQSDSLLEEYSAQKLIPESVLRNWGITGVKHGGTPAIRIPYLDSDGAEAAVRYRKAMAGSSGDRGAMCESVTRLDRHKPCRSEIR